MKSRTHLDKANENNRNCFAWKDKEREIYSRSYAIIRFVIDQNCETLETGFNSGLEGRFDRDLIVRICDSKLSDYSAVIGIITEQIIIQTAEIMMQLFDVYKFDYHSFPEKIITSASSRGDSPSFKNHLAFYRAENGKKIGYIVSTELSNEIDIRRLKSWISEYRLDGVKVYRLSEEPRSPRTIGELANYENPYIQTISIRDFFTLTPCFKYDTYKDFIETLNLEIQNIIGYKIITIPDAHNVDLKDLIDVHLQKQQFTDRLRTELYAEYKKKIAYGTLVDFPKKIEEQICIIEKNYIQRKLYRALIGSAPFAESFVSSEWYYLSNTVTNAIEQTAIVAGYIKSVEQLLYSIIFLYKNEKLSNGKELTIKRKNAKQYKGKAQYIELSADENEIDSSFGPLIGCINYSEHLELWEVEDVVKDYVVSQLHSFRCNIRNDFFHKNNVSPSEIAEIRNAALYLHFLLLGTLKIPYSKEEKLGITEYEDLSYEEFEKKIDSLLVSLSANQNESSIHFSLRDTHNRSQLRWHLSVFIYEHPDEEIHDGVVYKSIGQSTTLVHNNEHYELLWDSYKDVDTFSRDFCVLLQEYLRKGRYALTLKSYSQITIGQFYRIDKTLYE